MNWMQKFGNRNRKIAHELALKRTAAAVARKAQPGDGVPPVIFFYASTRKTNFNLNAAFSQLAEWSLRLQGVPVVRFACQSGMTRCVLGSNRDDANQKPDCESCIRFSQKVFAGGNVRWFAWQDDAGLDAALDGLSVSDLMQFEWQNLPLGVLALPALRWMLRRHNLADDEPTRFFYREFIRSAWNVARQFSALLDEIRPQAVVLFNGQFYPEAVAKYLARERGIRTITHEVGLQPFSAFFTTGEATAYPLDIPADFDLNETQNARLDAYLSRRFQGDFTMAGVRFWPQMQGLDEAFLAQAARFKQIVPVFTNVIFDTSQPHANVVFKDMFHWLDTVLDVAHRHPETLFVLRAHPDEARPGKESRESVAMWAASREIEKLPNMIFVPPNEYISSYDLIQRAKFVLVYNSTIGLEAAIMGAAVLSGGRSRFTPYDTVFFPSSVEAFVRQMEDFLDAAQIVVPPSQRRNARRFLYWQLFRSSLPFGDFLRAGNGRYEVHLRFFPLKRLLPENSLTMQTISDGILRDGDFMYPES